MIPKAKDRFSEKIMLTQEHRGMHLFPSGAMGR